VAEHGEMPDWQTTMSMNFVGGQVILIWPVSPQAVKQCNNSVGEVSESFPLRYYTQQSHRLQTWCMTHG